MTHKTLLPLLLGLVMSLGIARAEQKVDFNDQYELHYIVINSTDVTPDIAAEYDLKRSGTLGLLNLSVLKKQPNGVAIPVDADVAVRVRNLLGQEKSLPMRKVEEENAIYHLGQPRFDDREMLWFDVTVRIPGEPEFEYSFSDEMWEESDQ